MSEAIAMDRYETPLTPESWGKLGMWIFLAGDAMSFGGLLCAYGALRLASAEHVDPKLRWPVPQEHLGIALTAFMTFLLIVTSLTMVRSLSALKRGDIAMTKRNLAMTILGGATFLGLQAKEWSGLMLHEHMVFSHNPWGNPLFGSTFFTLTGFHGMHVFSGVVYLTVMLFKVMSGKYGAAQAGMLEIAGLYWHFVDLVWILVFTFVYLI